MQPKGEHREEKVGLSVVDFFGKSLALLESHALDAEHGIDEKPIGDRCHGAIVQRRLSVTWWWPLAHEMSSCKPTEVARQRSA
ncbi:hypothetical protein LJR130_007123 [Variovorax sp. LjRoot130]|uniref:hypothetical protein n=1 Tax=Variovorax sp. LjRoot130 TaxID=3342261 RepID=UPI003ECDFB7C